MPRPKALERRQFVCSWCSLIFFKQEHLSRHTRSHTQEKPFTCNVCRKAFSRRDTLLRHARAHKAPPKDRQRMGLSILSNCPVGGLQGELISSASSADPVPGDGVLEQPFSLRSTGDFGGIRNPGPEGFPLPMQWPGPYLSADGFLDSVEYTGSSLRNFNIHESIHGNDMAWNVEGFPCNPFWQASPGFDLHTINSVLMDPATDPFEGRMSLPTIDDPTQQSSDSFASFSQTAEIVRRQWFTYLEPQYPSPITVDHGVKRTKVDENYRENLSHRLQTQNPSEPLPSTEFLVFFSRFNPIFPVIHAPTFRPSDTHSLLLLSICAIGSSFLGCRQATLQGRKIYDRLHKAILNSWESIIPQGKPAALALIQAGVLGQTFGMLSGRPSSLLSAQSFHGTILTWAKRCGVFHPDRSELCLDHEDDQSLEDAWKAWVQEEEQSRVSAALYIHDAEFSMLFNTEPSMRHSASKLSAVSPRALWLAPTAREWNTAVKNLSASGGLRRRESNIRLSGTSTSAVNSEPTSFRTYCELEVLAASINEAKEVGPWPSASSQLELSLLQFHDEHLAPTVAAARDPFCLDILWHSMYISLFADLNRLEMAAGRDGHEKLLLHSAYAKEWSLSSDGRRCALHGVMILRKAQSLAIGTEPAIHVPHALYYAAMIWYSYTEFGSGDDEDASLPTPVDQFPELTKLGVDGQSLLSEGHGFKTCRPSTLESMTLVSLIDLLRHIGHFKISDRMATLMTSIIHGNPEGQSLREPNILTG